MRAGQRVGKYVLGERIAQGGMAEVWAARVEGPEGFVKPVAMKFILENFTGDTEFERLFVNEARVAARLQHANLVTIFDFDKVPASAGEVGRYYIAMERVEGHDLRRVFQAAESKGRLFSHTLALHVAGEILKGLRYVHERRDSERGTPLGLIHRDVSPHNVLVGMGGEVKLSDFGIAKAMTQSLGTRSGMIRGKLSYASPEQLRAEAIDHRTDQFALGIALWEMLTHRRLFEGVDEVEIIGRVLRCEIPPMGDTPFGQVHPAIETVVRTMLSPSRDDRYPTTAAALSAVLALPGYTHDSAVLVDLMREVFPEAERAAAKAETVRIDSQGGFDTPPPYLGGAGGETRTITGSEVGRASPVRARVSQTPVPRAGFPRDPVTGSSYVSGFDGDLAMTLRPKARWPWVAGGIVLSGIAVAGFFVLRAPFETKREHVPAGAHLEEGRPRRNDVTPAPALPLPAETPPASTDVDQAQEAVVVPPRREMRASDPTPASRHTDKSERARRRKGAVALPAAPSTTPGPASPTKAEEPHPSTKTVETEGGPRGPSSSNSAPIIP